MSRRGFALLAVLWLVTALTVLAGVTLAVARTGSETTRNRMLLARAGWAREACVEILLARYAQSPTVRRLDRVDLGRGTWCDAVLDDPGAKLNLNVADRDALLALLLAAGARPGALDSLADALLDWRDADTIPRPDGLETPGNRNGPLADVAELGEVRGFDAALVAHLSSFVTTRGTGAINVNAAPAPVLRTLPGMSDEALRVVLGGRASESTLQSTDELAALLSKSARAVLFAQYPEFVRAVTFGPAQLVAVVRGGVTATPTVARATLTLVPVPGRLVVIRRETE